jgi:hypothetical protein
MIVNRICPAGNDIVARFGLGLGSVVLHYANAVFLKLDRVFQPLQYVAHEKMSSKQVVACDKVNKI